MFHQKLLEKSNKYLIVLTCSVNYPIKKAAYQINNNVYFCINTNM